MLAPSLSLSFLLSLFLSLSLSISLFLSVGDFTRLPSPSRELLFSVCTDWIHACFFQKHRSHTAAHCNTLQYPATPCNTLQHTALHCNTLQHTALHCNTLQHTALHRYSLHYTATHCITLQHTANTLPERLTRSLSKALSFRNTDPHGRPASYTRVRHSWNRKFRPIMAKIKLS